MSKDRHRPGYYKEYNKTHKKDRHRKGYYHDYNQAHPERLERGFTKGYVNGNVSEGAIKERKVRGDIYFDELGRAHSKDFFNPTFSDLLDAKLADPRGDDDWYEGCNDD